MKKFNVAVVGATGMVGGKFLEVLTERQLPVDNYYLFASAKSAGKKIDFMGKEHTVIELTKENVTALKGKVDFALFSAGAGVSKEFAPILPKWAQSSLTTRRNGACTTTFPLSCPRSTPRT